MLTIQRLIYRWKHRNLRLPPRRIIMRNCTGTFCFVTRPLTYEQITTIVNCYADEPLSRS